MTTTTMSAPHAARAGAAGLATQPDPWKWRAIGLASAFTLTLPGIIAAMVLLRPAPPVPAWSVEATALGVDRVEITRGEVVYHNSCAVCHGPTGEGVPRLGKPLRNSAFVQSSSTAELFRLVVEGRPIGDPLNTTGSLMPPRGAQALGDAEVTSVITYLQAIQDPEMPTASTAAWELGGDATGGGVGAAVTAVELTAHPGYDLFVASCAACHGQGGEGMESLGLPLTTSGFVRGKSDRDLITFVKMGRASWDENNTTGIDMPPKGGNPAITDDQLQMIVDYLRAMQKEAMGS